jgi:hypothetical protein
MLLSKITEKSGLIYKNSSLVHFNSKKYETGTIFYKKKVYVGSLFRVVWILFDPLSNILLIAVVSIIYLTYSFLLS